MTNALEIIYYIFDKAVDFVFNKMAIVPNVYVGWVCVFVLIMAILIGSLLAVPRASEVVSNYRNDVRRGKYDAYNFYKGYYYRHRG